MRKMRKDKCKKYIRGQIEVVLNNIEEQIGDFLSEKMGNRFAKKLNRINYLLENLWEDKPPRNADCEDIGPGTCEDCGRCYVHCVCK